MSVQICTLNEANNIEGVISAVVANGPSEIVVIDGGSTDNTKAIAERLGARVIDAGPIGLAAQRQQGVFSTDLPMIAFVDADDRPTPSFLSTLIRELEENHLHAIDGVTRPAEVRTYWQRGWSNSILEERREVTRTNMVGRPALYLRTALLEVGLDPSFSYGSEDTDLSRRFQNAGKAQAHGTGINYRVHEKCLSKSVKKWLGYGKGYALFASKHPDTRYRIFLHSFLGVGLRRYFEKLPSSGPFFFFYLLQGLFCGLGFVINLPLSADKNS